MTNVIRFYISVDQCFIAENKILMGNNRRPTLKYRPQDNHLFAAAVTKTCLEKKMYKTTKLEKQLTFEITDNIS